MPFGKKQRTRCRRMVLAALLFVGAFSPIVSAQEGGRGITSSSVAGLQISTLPEIKASFTQGFTFPLPAGDGPLTRDNNIKTEFGADVSPVSVNGTASLTLTPVAFLEVSGGVRAGSGWNINIFGGDVYGIGINAPEGGEENYEGPPRKSEMSGDAFDGLLWSAWGGGAFQFDLAAVFPGDWNHVLFRTYHEARYSAYTAAADGESWVFENDDRENRNGWVYNSSYVLAYQMPASPVFNMVGIMAEMRKNLYNTPNGDFWGDSLGQWTFSGLFNFEITPALSTALVLQFRTRRNYGSTDLENRDFLFYQDRELLDNQGERRLVFYRAALLMNYKFH